MLMCDELVPKGYMNSILQFDKDSHQSTFSFVFTFDGVVISWRSAKQSCIDDSTIEVEYVVVSKATKEAIQLRKFLMGVGIVSLIVKPKHFYENNGGGDMVYVVTKRVTTLRESTICYVHQFKRVI